MMTERSEVKMGAMEGGEDRDQRPEADGGGWEVQLASWTKRRRELASKGVGTQG